MGIGLQRGKTESTGPAFDRVNGAKHPVNRIRILRAFLAGRQTDFGSSKRFLALDKKDPLDFFG
jgi:hypothetical protein